jgi:RNA polymerase sigma-70 factor (ECF subfamily)
MSESDVNLNAKMAALVAAALQGEERARGALIEATQDKLYRFCFMLGRNKEGAEDLCQEVYLKAFRNLAKIKNPEAFQGWLYQIAKNLFIDMKRAKGGEPPPTEDENASPDMETAMHVREILSQFETEDRALLLLVELEGQSYKEAAETLETTEDAVRSKLHRLRQAFLKKFTKGETN